MYIVLNTDDEIYRVANSEEQLKIVLAELWEGHLDDPSWHNEPSLEIFEVARMIEATVTKSINVTFQNKDIS